MKTSRWAQKKCYNLARIRHKQVFILHKSKGERKDIELVEEEDPRIGVDCSNATSNKSEICKEEAGNAA